METPFDLQHSISAYVLLTNASVHVHTEAHTLTHTHMLMHAHAHDHTLMSNPSCIVAGGSGVCRTRLAMCGRVVVSSELERLEDHKLLSAVFWSFIVFYSVSFGCSLISFFFSSLPSLIFSSSLPSPLSSGLLLSFCVMVSIPRDFPSLLN